MNDTVGPRDGATFARPNDRVLVIVAHPDDETFGCGSLIAHAADAGAPVTVVCATRGEAGERHDADDRRDLAEVREAELRAAGAILGVETIAVLDYGDSGFDGTFPDGSLCAAPLGEVAEVVSQWIERTDATVVVVLEGDDGHRDHRWIRDATIRALADAGSAAASVRAHAVALPNGLMRRWAAEMAAVRPDIPYLDIDLAVLGTPDAELTEIDCSAQLAVREAAIAAHRSQRSPFEDLSPGLRRAFLTRTFVRDLRR